MTIDPVFWRDLRHDFEPLLKYDFRLSWSSVPPLHILTRQPMESQWSWWRYPEESLRVQFEAIATKGARALGLDSVDDWLDRIRLSGFAPFGFTNSGHETHLDGKLNYHVGGSIENIVQHSMTLCHMLEADAMDNQRFEHMNAQDYRTMAFWLSLKAQFLALPNRDSLSAHYDMAPGEWRLLSDLSDDHEARSLELAFEHLAIRAAIALHLEATPDRLGAWLKRIRENGNHFVSLTLTDGKGDLIPGEQDAGRIGAVVVASAEYCDVLGTQAFSQEVAGDSKAAGTLTATAVNVIGGNLKRLYGNAGWSMNKLARITGIDKKTVHDHVHGRAIPSAANLKIYADALTKGLERPVLVEEITG